MTKKLIISLSVMMMCATGVQATELALSFNDFSAQLAVMSEIDSYKGGNSLLTVRGLYNDRKETELLSVSFDVLGPLGNTGLEIGAGVSAYYAQSQAAGASLKDDIAAGGIGGIIRFTPPGLERLSFLGKIYYCPDILTGLDGEKLIEIEGKASFEIAPNAKVFATVSEIKADIENKGRRDLDHTIRVGLTLGF